MFYNAEGEIIKRAPEGDPMELLKSLHHVKSRDQGGNDLKRKNDSNDLGIVFRKKKEDTQSLKKATEEKSSLSILGSMYADSSSDADS